MNACNGEEASFADALPLDGVQRLGEDVSMDFRAIVLSVIDGENPLKVSDLGERLEMLMHGLTDELRRLAGELVIPLGVSLLMRMVLSDAKSSKEIVQLVCRIGCIAVLVREFLGMRQVAISVLESASACTEVLVPVLIAAVTLTGAEGSAAVMSPMSSLCIELIQGILSRWGIALGTAAALAAAAGNLSGGIRLKKLHSLFRQTLHWLIGIMMTVFMGSLSIQGKLGAGRDGIAMRTAKYTIESVVPVIGGEMSDSLGSILSTAGMLRNAVGATGILLLAVTCMIPLGRLAGMTLMLKAVSAVSEPLGDENMTTMIGQFSAAAEMLLVISAAAWMLCALLIGSSMSASGGMF